MKYTIEEKEVNIEEFEKLMGFKRIEDNTTNKPPQSKIASHFLDEVLKEDIITMFFVKKRK